MSGRPIQARPPGAKQAAGPLGVALSALESLTEAVELLSTVADGEGAADLPALAGELREAADALAGAAGYEPTSDEGEAGNEGDDGDGGDVGAVITASARAAPPCRARPRRSRAPTASCARRSPPRAT
ncbi:MAG TPA: hypothetical protein VFS43_00445 [Polyangiaceae bacterium]|nr:hypothetical protein [Polyangiaceae bacterium]